MTTVTVTVYIDETTAKAVIEAVHPGPLTPQQVLEYLVASAIEEKGSEENDSHHAIRP